MNTHLKGPWRIVERETLEDGGVYPRHILTEVGEYQICLLESPNMAALGYERTPAEQERDHVIAAAPELLAALREAMQAVEVFHGKEMREVFRDHAPEWKRWNAAISKAEGKAS